MKTLLATVLVFCLGVFSSAQAQTNLRFVFDQGSPPYSYKDADGNAIGLFPELVKAAFAALPEYSITVEAYPWARAQEMVQRGVADGFMTYPSEGRKKYAVFNSAPGFVEDIGYLVFVPKNPNAERLRTAKSFEDLRPFLFLGSSASEWETDNVPGYIKKESIAQDESRLHILIQRRHGDFIIMGRENCNYLLNKLGYGGRLEFAKVNFLPDAQVPFNLGIAKMRPDAVDIIGKLNKAMASPKLKAELQKIQKRYQSAN